MPRSDPGERQGGITHPLSGAQVGTRVHRSLNTRMTMTHDFRPFALAWNGKQKQTALNERRAALGAPSAKGTQNSTRQCDAAQRGALSAARPLRL